MGGTGTVYPDFLKFLGHFWKHNCRLPGHKMLKSQVKINSWQVTLSDPQITGSPETRILYIYTLREPPNPAGLRGRSGGMDWGGGGGLLGEKNPPNIEMNPTIYKHEIHLFHTWPVGITVVQLGFRQDTLNLDFRSEACK